jgi:hypothetical protein
MSNAIRSWYARLEVSHGVLQLRAVGRLPPGSLCDQGGFFLCSGLVESRRHTHGPLEYRTCEDLGPLKAR